MAIKQKGRSLYLARRCRIFMLVLNYIDIPVCWNTFLSLYPSSHFLAHLSWKLKWAFLITCCLFVCKLFTFSTSSPVPLGQFQPNVAQIILEWRGFKFVQMKGHALFPRGDNSKNVKFYWKYLKIFFFRTNGPVSTKVGTKHLRVTGIQVCSNEGPRSFPRGDNSKRVKFYWKYFLKILLQKHLDNFNKTWHKSSLCKGDSSLFKCSFSKGR